MIFDKLLILIKENKGFLKTSDAIALGFSKKNISDFIQSYKLERVAHGIYMEKDMIRDDLYIIQLRYPKVVFSHETALQLLNFSNREPSLISLTVRTGVSTSRLTTSNIKIYKVKDDLFTKGIVEVASTSGQLVRVYNLERTICDLFRSRKNIEIQVLNEVIKQYLRYKNKNLPLLLRYAKDFSVEKIIRQYLEVLL